DHAGFEKLKQLKEFLSSSGHECVNYGPTAYDSEDDYPDFIRPAAEAVAKGECEVGIIFGGSGQGEAMTANRVFGVRCAVYYGKAKAAEAVDVSGHSAEDEYEILRLSRQHNDANMLSLAGRFLNNEAIELAVSIWVNTPFSEEERHVRRIAKIDGQDS
ncbi:MAG TPA: RpiB/LacA/LacB family sugar-phosphate isomerase, partial [Candidatus Saccharimonadales bacterium]|nr:RpiB/LacA/LacB family sugar-phosphate isomerase [Candidatus Saccharimonadales bacterium]